MNEYYDIVIVGTGVAGLFCALHIDENQKVLLITKDDLEKSNSYLAQGGISTLKGKEDYNVYLEDTLKAGRYKNTLESVDIMIRSSNEVIDELINLGIVFDKEGDEFSFTREGAHSINRIMHHQDITGQEITQKLLNKVKEKKHITIQTHHTLLDLVTQNNICRGIVVANKDEIKRITAKVVVLATGGVGGLFKNSTNFSHITGDGVAIAIKNNIQVQDINYIQIHPTCLYTQKPDRRFLISEAMRGEGAYLLNTRKKRFIDELLPRDVVSMAIHHQMDLLGSDYVYLSAAHLGEMKIKKRFPNIYKMCLNEGYDMLKEPIPITPAQHYFMGGIKVDTEGSTSMMNLYAIGETSCNGVHGANRLASNSLLESLVFAKRAASALSRTQGGIIPAIVVSHLAVYDPKALEHVYKELILQEIKRRDEKFYAKWCHKEYQCG